MSRKQDEAWDRFRSDAFDAWSAKNDREVALRRALVSVADALERATKADDDERSLLFHISLIEKICFDARSINEIERKGSRP